MPIQASKKEHLVVVLDGAFCFTVMDRLGVPDGWQLRVWQGVQMLHDLVRHELRGFEDLCLHPEFPLADFIQSCPSCAKRLRCNVCHAPFEFHSPCEGTPADALLVPGNRVKTSVSW